MHFEVAPCVAERRAWFDITGGEPEHNDPLPVTLSAPTSPKDATRRRVQAVVPLRLLEVMRDQDVPPEVLESEDTAVTLPRRLGLSDVVDRQIRSLREDVRKRTRLGDSEVRDLFRLVTRRPDAKDIFHVVGRRLAGEEERSVIRRFLPRGLAIRLARRRVRRRLQRLFGRRVGGVGKGSFAVEGRSLPFIEADPGGAACYLVTGLCETVLERATRHRAEVVHSFCQSRGDDRCRWEAAVTSDPVPTDGGTDGNPVSKAG